MNSSSSSRKSLIRSSFSSRSLHLEVGYTCGMRTAVEGPLRRRRRPLLLCSRCGHRGRAALVRSGLARSIASPLCVFFTTAHTHVPDGRPRLELLLLGLVVLLVLVALPRLRYTAYTYTVVRSGVSQSVKQGRALGRHPPSQSRSIVDPVRILYQLTCPPGGGMPPGVPCPMAAWPCGVCVCLCVWKGAIENNGVESYDVVRVVCCLLGAALQCREPLPDDRAASAVIASTLSRHAMMPQGPLRVAMGVHGDACRSVRKGFELLWAARRGGRGDLASSATSSRLLFCPVSGIAISRRCRGPRLWCDFFDTLPCCCCAVCGAQSNLNPMHPLACRTIETAAWSM